MRGSEVNAFLKPISGQSISLKDSRTLTASPGVLDRLGQLEPPGSERGRRRQIREAIAPVANKLANTLTVCRTSYFHDSVISAFESGRLAKARDEARAPLARMKLLSDLLRSDGCRLAVRSVAVAPCPRRRRRKSHEALRIWQSATLSARPYCRRCTSVPEFFYHQMVA